MNLPFVSFAAASVVAALGLTWLMWNSLPHRRPVPVRLALLCSAVWAAVLASASPYAQGLLPAILELLRYGCWLVAMPALMRLPAGSWLARWNWTLAAAGLAIALFSPAFSFLLLAFVGLVNVEQLLRNADSSEKPGTKLCMLGLGGIFAYDLFLFAESVLLESRSESTWVLRGLINAVLLPLVLTGVARLSASRSNLFVSRQAVFYSTAFIAVGLYLLATALAAAYLRGQSEAWGEWLRLLLLVGAGLVLAMVIASESPWRRLKVFLAKHFYSNKYDYRVEWLRFVRTLEVRSAEDARVTSVRAIAQIFESPCGLLYVKQEGEHAFSAVASWSASGDATPESPPIEGGHDMVRFMAGKKWVIDLEEYRRQPETYGSTTLPTFLLAANAPWRIVSPLLQDEHLLGFVVLANPPQSFTMSYEDRDLLGMIGRHAATLLAQQIAARRLAESRQFDAFNRFAAFVMHDLKNSVAQLQLLVNNATRHRSNPEFIDDAFLTIENTAGRISRLISQLQEDGAGTARQAVGLQQAVQAALHRCAAKTPVPAVVLPSEPLVVEAEPERLTAMLEHLLRNAQDAAGPSGEVRIAVEQQQEWVIIRILDTGPGMDAGFIRDQLFRPFSSTKGAKGMGIGAYQAREYAVQMGGTLEVQSRPGSGTQFTIRIPLWQHPDPTAF